MPDDAEYHTPTRSTVRRYLQQMDPERFEHFVADFWERLGWRTRVVGEPGDRGIDVIATATTDEGGPQKQLIQAKRYGPNTTVGSPEVQQYASLRLQADDVDQVTIVTTGGFSRQAEDMAPDLDVILVDGEELLGLIEETDAWDVVAEHVDGIELADAVDRNPSQSEEPNRSGILGKLLSVFR